MDVTPRSTPYGRRSGRQLPFSTRLSDLADVPAIFRKTVQRLLEGRESSIRHILYTPEFGTFGEFCPATLFVVTAQEWLAFSAEKAGAPTVCYADFSQTRLVEFSLALLQGRLVLEFGEASEVPCILRFSLTSWDLFRDALAVVLAGGADIRLADLVGRSLPPSCDCLSFAMRSTLQEVLLPGDALLDLCAWTRADVTQVSDRDYIHPGGLVLTEKYLFVITADDPSDHNQTTDPLPAYNRGVVFLSRQFPIGGRVLRHEHLLELQLDVGVVPQASSVNVVLPISYAGVVEQMLRTLA